MAAKRPGTPFGLGYQREATGEESAFHRHSACRDFGRSPCPAGVTGICLGHRPGALDFARTGIYSAADLAGLDPERRKPLVLSRGQWVAGIQDLRELCVFSAHDLTWHPPFIRWILISCRNILIYFKLAQQAEPTRPFHFADQSRWPAVAGPVRTREGRQRAVVGLLIRPRFSFRRCGCRCAVCPYRSCLWADRMIHGVGCAASCPDRSAQPLSSNAAA